MNAHFVRCSILALAAAFAAPAQTAGTVKANVPFAFTVQGRDMPAGEYVVAHDNYNAAVILKCQEHGVSVIVPTNALESPNSRNTGKLVFHRYGGQYFLAEVWGDGRDGRQLLTTKQERNLALQASPQRTIVAATR